MLFRSVYYLRVEIGILTGHESWDSLVTRLCDPPVPKTRKRFYA